MSVQIAVNNTSMSNCVISFQLQVSSTGSYFLKVHIYFKCAFVSLVNDVAWSFVKYLDSTFSNFAKFIKVDIKVDID